MHPRPKLAGSALLVLASIHAWWGLRMLLASDLLVAASQLVSVGGLVLAGVAAGHRSRGGLAVGFGIAAAATALRFLANVGSPNAFMGATGLLMLGMAGVAWGARRLDDREDALGAVALRGGAFLMAGAYLAFLGLSVGLGGASFAASDFVVRALAAASFALCVDAAASKASEDQDARPRERPVPKHAS